MKNEVLTIKLAGPAGLGIKSSGRLLANILKQHEFHTWDYSEYPSLVRGGHNTFQVSLSRGKIFSVHKKVDIFFSLKPGHWQEHQNELKRGGLILAEEKVKSKQGKFIILPLTEIAAKAGGEIFSNTICLGITAFLLGLDTKICQQELAAFYPKKVDENRNAFILGYEFAEKNLEPYLPGTSRKKSVSQTAVVDGNEAFGWGFLAGGGNFYASYPMTPATGLLHFLAEKQKDYKIIVRHPEDEISAANMAAGAAFAGSRAAVGTSGGGFALMAECVSFCGMAEIGMVFYIAQRPAPATGLPTWTSQGDLLFAVFSGHGDFPKIVLAPGDHQQAFDFGWQALNLAEKLQLPVIILSDKMLAESSVTLPEFDLKKAIVDRGKTIKNKVSDNFQRYSWQSPDGCSYRSLPGQKGGEFLANSYEHDQDGFATEDGPTAARMTAKRMKKLQTALRLAPKPELIGSARAKNIIVSWGSAKSTVQEALKQRHDSNWSLLQIKTLWPLHPEIKKILAKAKRVITVENNYSGQLATLLKTNFDFKPDQQWLKFDGRPFFPEEINEKISKLPHR